MIGEMYRFSGVKAIQIPSTRFNEIAGLVEKAIMDVTRAHRADVQVHYIPITDEGTTTSIIAMLHYGDNVSPF